MSKSVGLAIAAGIMLTAASVSASPCGSIIVMEPYKPPPRAAAADAGKAAEKSKPKDDGAQTAADRAAKEDRK